MKKRKLSTRLLSILVCVCMVLCFLPAVAFAADMTGGEVLYLKPNSEWASADARFAIYVYGSGDAWESMVPVEGADGIYQVTVPSGNWTNVIFCRMNPATTENNWDNRWNQSGNLVYDGVNNLCTIKNGQWDCDMNVTWSVYAKDACPHENHGVDGKCTACGELVEHNYVGGSCVCGAENPDAFKVYFINSPKWDEVAAYAWINGGAGLSWPGIPMTKSGDTVNGCDVYEVIFDMAYESVIFNNNNQGSQTSDLAMMPGQYYDMNNDTWYESLEDVPVVEEPACTHENHDVDGKCTACGEPVEHKYVGGSCVCGAVNPDAITVYYINSDNWDQVFAYAWNEGGQALEWPGVIMTKTDDTVNGFDVYAVTFDVPFEQVIFTNNSGNQTTDLAMMPGQYFNQKDKVWYESLDQVPVLDPLATDVFLVGAFNEWSCVSDEFKLVAEGATTASVSMELEAETKYDFKIVRGGAWTSCDTAITGDISDLVFSGDVSGNCSITTTAADTYVFAYDLGSNTLSVVYPEVEEPACTHENHDVDGKCTACGVPVEHNYVDGVCACGSKNGIVAENGSLYYYVDGKLNYAGLIEIDGDLYYVRYNGELVQGKTYWPTKTNGLKDYAGYYFDEDGKLHERNGLVEENGGLYYYVNSKLYYAGLIEIEGNLYYIRSNGQAVTGCTYWTTKTNGLKEYAGYYFDETGKLCE